MARVVFKNVDKFFDKNHVLKNINLEINDGEFVAILGPSGCGKTTLLRILAGFETIDNGEIVVDGDTISSAKVHIKPEDRKIGMVFQSYALWPHMRVSENIAFPLKVKKIKKNKIKEEVFKALSVTKLNAFKDRKPEDLSGGQQQRVALARCLIMKPKLMLLDEPLANLDIHLKEGMIDEFRDFHKKTKSTMLYVTHDQSEAMVLADRIVMMEDGEVLQFDTPNKLYKEPNCEEVANFVGKGMIIPVKILQTLSNNMIEIDVFDTKITIQSNKKSKSPKLCLRAENLKVSTQKGFFATIIDSIFYGAFTILIVTPKADKKIKLRVMHLNNDIDVKIGDTVQVDIKECYLL